jgi:hypothetical protein
MNDTRRRKVYVDVGVPCTHLAIALAPLLYWTQDSSPAHRRLARLVAILVSSSVHLCQRIDTR